MKALGLYIILSLLTGNPILALVILLVILFFAERRFVGILPDFFAPWKRAGRVRQLRREVGLNPANAEACLELGEAYFRQGKYGEAASFLESTAGKMAGHSHFYFYLGASYYYMGKLEEGKKEIEKAIAANPKSSLGEPYLYLIRIYLEQKLPGGEVERVFDQLLQYGSPRVFYQAGQIFLNYGDKDKARRLFRETIENYEACRGALRRAYRRWAVLSKISLLSIK